MEEWKPIPGTKYEASTLGQIRRVGKVAPLSPWIHKERKGPTYLVVELFKDGKKRKHATIHRLVLEAFVGPCPPGKQTRHLNGNSHDNRLENLTWGTLRENTDDRIKHHPDYYLTEAEILAVRNLPQYSCRAVARLVGCKKSVVSQIRNNQGRYALNPEAV